MLQRAALVAQVVVAVHGFSADTLLQTLPCLLPSASALPLPATVRLGILLGRLNPQQFLEPIVVGCGVRLVGCRRTHLGELRWSLLEFGRQHWRGSGKHVVLLGLSQRQRAIGCGR